MECDHVHLIKVVNMAPNTYKCQDCKDLIKVELKPYELPKAVYGTKG
jgi:hypothetical protein